LPRDFFQISLPLEVVTVNAFRAEISPDVFAVGHGRRRGVIAALVAVIVDAAFVRSLLPQNLTGVAIEAESFESVKLIHAVPVGVRELLLAHHPLRRFVAGGFGGAFDVGGQENFLAPDDRLRIPAYGDRRLP